MIPWRARVQHFAGGMIIDLVSVVRRLGGAGRTADLRAAGATKRDLADAVRAGLLVRPRRGVFASPETSEVIIEALGHRGRIACATAARDRGLWTLDAGHDEPVHTWVHPDRHPARHRRANGDDVGCCLLHRDAVVDLPDLVRVGILHCLVQLAKCHGDEAFFAAFESALRHQFISPQQRARLRAAVPAQLVELVDLARLDADSGLESIVRLRLHRLGIAVACQVKIPGVGTVDFVIGDCLILEADGATHGGDNRHRDLVRDAIAMGLGFVTLRFDSALILHDWETVESAILAALDRTLHVTDAGRRAKAVARLG
jgi:very-short-patch-repair endonuclease